MRKKKGRPVWFRMQLANRLFFEALPDDVVGRGVKMALVYFDTGELPGKADPMTMAVFSVLQKSADKSWQEYEGAVEAGKAGADARYGIGRVQGGYASAKALQHHPHTDQDIESEVEEELIKRESSIGAPSIDSIIEYMTHHVKAEGQAVDVEKEAKAFVDYYSARGWLVSGSPVKDWQALARRWLAQAKPNNTLPMENPLLRTKFY